MGKVKINLASGSVEKSVLSAFKGAMGQYIIIDNEVIGSMGLPIILVSKVVGNKLEKVVDQNEWAAVKDVLRNIIAGNQIVYINVPSELSGSDNFYSQLTLPVASFDSIKNNYKPVVAPTEPAVTDIFQNQIPVTPTPVAPIAPVTPTPSVTQAPAAPVNVTPVQVAPVMPSPVAPAPVQVTVPPVVEPITSAFVQNKEVIDYKQDKEAFLKACENMFDALVAKFNK